MTLHEHVYALDNMPLGNDTFSWYKDYNLDPNGHMDNGISNYCDPLEEEEIEPPGTSTGLNCGIAHSEIKNEHDISYEPRNDYNQGEGEQGAHLHEDMDWPQIYRPGVIDYVARADDTVKSACTKAARSSNMDVASTSDIHTARASDIDGAKATHMNTARTTEGSISYEKDYGLNGGFNILGLVYSNDTHPSECWDTHTVTSSMVDLELYVSTFDAGCVLPHRHSFPCTNGHPSRMESTYGTSQHNNVTRTCSSTPLTSLPHYSFVPSLMPQLTVVHRDSGKETLEIPFKNPTKLAGSTPSSCDNIIYLEVSSCPLQNNYTLELQSSDRLSTLHTQKDSAPTLYTQSDRVSSVHIQNDSVPSLQTQQARQLPLQQRPSPEELPLSYKSARERWATHCAQHKNVRPPQEPMICTHCDSRFDEVGSYLGHLDAERIKHDNFCPDPECAFSVVGFRFRWLLRRHICNHHLKAYNSDIGKSAVHLGRLLHRFLSYVYVCDDPNCLRAFYRRDSLLRHQRLIHGPQRRREHATS